jgi:hypothetical protein
MFSNEDIKKLKKNVDIVGDLRTRTRTKHTAVNLFLTRRLPLVFGHLQIATISKGIDWVHRCIPYSSFAHTGLFFKYLLDHRVPLPLRK